MGYYYKDLFHHIIEDYADSATDLRIISGYGSYSVAEHILKSYEHLNITLYIGMTSVAGISQDNHENFVRLVNEYKNRLNVYYQTTLPSTHIKLFTWIKDDKVITNLLGSANFTENGLFKLNELMVESSLDYNELFDFQELQSITCTSKEVYDKIHIHDEVIEKIELEVDNGLPIHINDELYPYLIEPNETGQYYSDNPNSNSQLFTQYRNYLRTPVGSRIKIEIPVIFQNQRNYQQSGVNNRFRNNKLGYLKKSNKFPFHGFFPYDTKLTFHTDDGEKLVGFLYEDRNDDLFFEEDIYNYFFKRLNLSKLLPISLEDLNTYGRQYVTILKLDETNYLFDFSIDT